MDLSHLPNFDEASRKELSAFVEREQAQARVNQSIHNFTSMCWDKCITSTPGSSFSRYESACLSNCVDRFLDMSLFLVKQIEQQRQPL